MDGCSPTPARLILADDHRVFADALQKLLDPPHRVVATVHCGDGLLAILPHVPADCLLLDLMMPGLHGLPLLPRIQQIQPALKIVILTVLEDHATAQACLRAGAHGFVPKCADTEELLAAISAVRAGEPYVSPRVSAATNRVGPAAAHPALAALTPRQREILLQLGHGRRPAQIAHCLGVSRSTITFHLKNLMRVLSVPTTEDLLQLAVLTAWPPGRSGGQAVRRSGGQAVRTLRNVTPTAQRQTADGHRPSAIGQRLSAIGYRLPRHSFQTPTVRIGTT